MNQYLSLIISLPTENATVRMRAWRALKASGAAVLRDGVYLMPDRQHCRSTLDTIAADVRDGGGSAWVLRVEPPDGADFTALFDRGPDYLALLADVAGVRKALGEGVAPGMLKRARKLRKALAMLAEIDFFPGEAQRQATAAVQDLERAAARALTPDEPHAVPGAIEVRTRADYRGRTWVTRRRPWVDRLASAWLIRRRIDPEARILWIESPRECAADALGFDFDGATFTHTAGRVTFEVLIASFDLAEPGLERLGALVHFLDVGGVQPPEAAGVESVLAGMRATMLDDDRLLDAASSLFDSLLTTFAAESPSQ
jgi:hypothetical protein